MVFGLKKAHDDLLRLWGVDPDESGGSTGNGVGSTGNGDIVVGRRVMRPKEFRKLLEAFMDDHGHLPRDPHEFERWLDN